MWFSQIIIRVGVSVFVLCLVSGSVSLLHRWHTVSLVSHCTILGFCNLYSQEELLQLSESDEKCFCTTWDWYMSWWLVLASATNDVGPSYGSFTYTTMEGFITICIYYLIYLFTVSTSIEIIWIIAETSPNSFKFEECWSLTYMIYCWIIVDKFFTHF